MFKSFKQKVSVVFVLTVFVLMLLFGSRGGISGFFGYESDSYKCINCSVVLISIDTARADHFSAYGYEKETSPLIDIFAEESILFENAYSTSAWTLPSHFSIFTSNYPEADNLFIFGKGSRRFNSSYKTITEILDDEGYNTAAFTGGGFVNAELGFGRGFDKYTTEGKRFEDNLDSTIEWIDSQNTNQKFFLFLHGFNLHAPYKVPEEYKKKFVTEAPENCDDNKIFRSGTKCLQNATGTNYLGSIYDSEISYADVLINDILTELKEKGLYENTIIIITSDHGDGLNAPHKQVGHIENLYQELIKIPFIIKLPNYEGKRISSEVSNIDIMPTLIDALGLNYTSGMDGASLIPLIEGNGEDKPIYSMTGSFSGSISRRESNKSVIWFSVINGADKLILSFDASQNKKYELFDIKADILEQNNLAVNSSETNSILKMENLIDDWAREIRLNIDSVYFNEKDRDKDELGNETMDQLRALGYMN